MLKRTFWVRDNPANFFRKRLKNPISATFVRNISLPRNSSKGSSDIVESKLTGYDIFKDSELIINNYIDIFRRLHEGLCANSMKSIGYVGPKCSERHESGSNVCRGA